MCCEHVVSGNSQQSMAKPMTRTRLLGLLLLLLSAVFDGHALTLGRMRGAAILSQGLDVSVQVAPDADESVASLCLEVDVFYADTRQDPGRVVVTAEPAAAGQPVQSLRRRMRRVPMKRRSTAQQRGNNSGSSAHPLFEL